MSNVLSYSAIKLYQECGHKYNLHYNQKLRPENRSSALFFGTAFDKAIGAVLSDPAIDETQVFDQWWGEQEINKIQTKLIDSFRIVYSLSEFDSDLLTLEDVKFFKAKALHLVPELMQEANDNILVVFKQCADKKKNSAWTDKEHALYQIGNWLSLRRKGLLMLKVNRIKVLPRFKTILKVQPEILLTDDKGNSLKGAADLTAIWEDGREIVFDYKTTTFPYEDTSVLTSEQLTIYCHALNIPVGGYITFGKRVNKNKSKVCKLCSHDGSDTRFKTCPNLIEGKRCNGEWNESMVVDIDVQIIIDTIPVETEDTVFDSIESSNVGISNKIFDQNFNSCRTKYGPCVYFNLCHANKDEGLVSTKEG